MMNQINVQELITHQTLVQHFVHCLTKVKNIILSLFLFFIIPYFFLSPYTFFHCLLLFCHCSRFMLLSLLFLPLVFPFVFHSFFLLMLVCFTSPRRQAPWPPLRAIWTTVISFLLIIFFFSLLIYSSVPIVIFLLFSLCFFSF